MIPLAEDLASLKGIRPRGRTNVLSAQEKAYDLHLLGKNKLAIARNIGTTVDTVGMWICAEERRRGCDHDGF